jgi:hypothetical protein
VKARQLVEATSNPENRRFWLEVAKAFEHFADLGKTPWHVERVEPKK